MLKRPSRFRVPSSIAFTLAFIASYWNVSQVRAQVQEIESAKGLAVKESAKLDELVLVGEGELPILISAPHGGTLKIVGVEARAGEGMDKGPAGYFTGRDNGTEELAKDVVEAIQKRLGKKPYFVISATHRKYLDPNRPEDIAFEDEDAKPAYQKYHRTCDKFTREINERFHSGLLLDIHGQGSSRETVYRGTNNGKTVKRLRDQFGELAHSGPQSLFGLLHEEGWTVYPNPFDGREQSGLNGGYIVQSHGSHQAGGIDAMQLEFGADYRSKANRKKTAETLAKAIEKYLELYVPKKPNR